MLAVIGRPLSRFQNKLEDESFNYFNGKNEHEKKVTFWQISLKLLCFLTKSQSDGTICFLSFHGATLFPLQDVICLFQPTNWYRENTARLCKMKAQGRCGWKT